MNRLFSVQCFTTENMQVNLRNPLCTGDDDEARKQGIHPGFETKGRHHQRSKIRLSVAP